ncbi:MAG: universal stress protein [Rhodothermales bacterium]
MTTQPIVVGLDFSEGAEAALIRAADLAERFHTRLHLVHSSSTAYSEYGGTKAGPAGNSYEQRMRAFAERALGGAKAVDVIGPEIVVRRGEAAADAVVRYADEIGAGLVVVGTHGRRGVSHFLMGSVAAEVVRRSPCPVLTVPNAAARTAPGPSAPVLVPVDLSAANDDALAAARLVADQFAAPVELVHVLEGKAAHHRPIPSLLTINDTVTDTVTVDRNAGSALRRLVEETVGDGAARTHIRHGRPAREIVDLAREIGAGLIVMATHGRTGLDHTIIGSVTERTLRAAPCPVLSLRAIVPDEAAS